MDLTDFPDSDPTMNTSKVFEAIIHQIKSSNLNFRLDQSPFSANISLKKSLVKNKNGIPLKPPPQFDSSILQNLHSENQALVQKNFHLEGVTESLRNEYEIAVNACEESFKIRSTLEN